MKRKLPIALTSLLILFSVTSLMGQRASTGNTVVMELENVPEFTAINMGAVANIKYTPGTTPSVRAEIPQKWANDVEITVSGGTLIVKHKSKQSNKNSGKERINIVASSAALSNIKLTGVGNLEIAGAMTTNDFNVTLTGVGNVETQAVTCTSAMLTMTGVGNIKIDRLVCETLSANVSGVGDIDIEGGNATEAKYTMSGVGKIRADELSADNVTATSSGVGSITCHANKSLTAKGSTTGKVRYSGNPATVDLKGPIKRL